MAATIMDGREVSRRLRPELERHARELKERYHCTPALAAVLVGDDPASRQYVRNKRRFAEELGFESRMVTLTAEEASTERLLEEILFLPAGKHFFLEFVGRAIGRKQAEPSALSFRVSARRLHGTDCGHS